MRLHKRPGKALGLTPVVTAGRELQHISLGLLRLEAGQSYSGETGEAEAAIILLGGSCDVEGDGFAYRQVGERTTVFDGRATTVYLPAGTEYRVTARTGLEAAVASSPAPAGGEPRLIAPADVVVNERGRPGFRRQVHDILDLRSPAHRLVLGETFNAAGEWSSYPPHKHDQFIPGAEVKMEEVYLFKVNPAQGFGVQVLYTNDGELDEAYTIKDGDVTILPFGYHPVAAAPGYQVYYLWVMAGQGRELVPNDDPAHAWVKQA